jgi:hypothetical protein
MGKKHKVLSLRLNYQVCVFWVMQFLAIGRNLGEEAQRTLGGDMVEIEQGIDLSKANLMD